MPTRTMRLWVLGRELARIREERGLTDADIRGRGLDPSTIWRWLRGETRKPRRSTIELFLTILEVREPLRAELLDLALHPNGPDWLRPYEGLLPETYATFIGFEAEAVAIRNWESAYVPGLLQTEAYTDALIRAVPRVTEDHVARQVEVRAQRRAVLGPLKLHAVVDEAVLRRLVGGPEVMRAQLAALAGPPHGVTVQVVPFERGAHAAGTGPFVTMDLPDPRAGNVVFAEYAGGLIFVGADERYALIWESLVNLALTPRDSAAFIDAVADGID